ncbi:hypothetical protein [Hymenobacter cheonanensis]|uniref:hypothetical protein n=1 Tax=Hymenobacter sp. CA2-7 TaxID=3063993 RepID=UPI00271382C4|nr:hypothetical protein [Hymenobacter sp. CA2-7]MDO7885351.1 hypothetical protein [Hymenobacter sp. CA2-7]
MEHPLEKVFSWLETGEAADYRTGVLLLQEHSGNRGLVNNLLKKESAANREKLHYELVKVGCGGRMEDVNEVLNHFAQAVQGAAPTPVQQVADVLTSQDFPAQPEPEHVPEASRLVVDDLTQLMAKVYNQRCQLSNSLATLDPADGPRVVGEILSLEHQYNALAQKRRNVLAGEQPAPAPGQPAPAEQPAAGEAAAAPAIDRGELVKQRGNLRSNISKAKKKAEESKSEEKRSEYAQKAAKLEVELQQVEMQLAQPQA